MDGCLCIHASGVRPRGEYPYRLESLSAASSAYVGVGFSCDSERDDVCRTRSKGAKLMTKFQFGATKVEPPPQEIDCAEIERRKLKHPTDRKSVVEGKSVPVQVGLGGGRT